MHWTFGQRIAAGFTLTLALTVLIGVVAVLTLRGVVADKDALLTEYTANLVAIERLNTSASEVMAYTRGYLLTTDEAQQASLQEARSHFAATWLELQPHLTSEPAATQRIEQSWRDYQATSDRALQLRRSGAALDAVSTRFDAEVLPAARALREGLDGATQRLTARLDEAKRRSSDAANQAIGFMLGLLALAVLLGGAVAVVLSRWLGRQIGEAISHLQSSSTELQAAASQQASGSGEQAAAMSEITTTIKELLSTSRQIAQSAQRVAAIADDTAGSADRGDRAVAQATESMQAIQRHVERIVQHMLDLGKRTQQIGGVLEIIKEMAEQTNILSINATIEAAGAGESGRRFAAVAEEIRKLADRVGNATGEVRGLIEEIRAAANTTVMATEDGSKAVELGTRQFAELANTFQGIVEQVSTTAEAAREIELSTKQQATAVEQVNLAVADAAQAAKETEASSRQTLQTSSQLATVSRELGQLVKPQARP